MAGVSSYLDLLPNHLLHLVVRLAFSSGPLLLGVQRTYGIVDTRFVIRDDHKYRKSNDPPTPVVKRALMVLWRLGLAGETRTQFRVVTMGTATVVRYNCCMRGFDPAGPAPSSLADLHIATAR